MKKTTLLLTTLMIPIMGMTSTKPDPIKSDLKLNQEIFVTDKNGVANPNIIINLNVGDTIRIYLPDGKSYSGIVKSTESINDEQFKFFGELYGEEKIGFGFALAKGGIFAGAIVFKETFEIYTLEFDKESKGYIFLKNFSNKKPTI